MLKKEHIAAQIECLLELIREEDEQLYKPKEEEETVAADWQAEQGAEDHFRSLSLGRHSNSF